MEGYEYMEAYRKAWTKLSRAMGIINNCLRFMNEQWGAEKQKRGVKAHTALLVCFLFFVFFLFFFVFFLFFFCFFFVFFFFCFVLFLFCLFCFVFVLFFLFFVCCLFG